MHGPIGDVGVVGTVALFLLKEKYDLVLVLQKYTYVIAKRSWALLDEEEIVPLVTVAER